ncbi:response regulator [Rhodobacteraceae bacterium N5(2021)]|uniref:histidine kinase n=1 Tax=Gymnodinialimonas phycosphaerae TaxID=2841589 RepID=A0A975TTF8_9RHOB|nr:ATP-binding protein [Gymnodinialimonas phycosphaerae]MBY4893872.1 response regulator [Gymnodinialimonas phycosphaerae]
MAEFDDPTLFGIVMDAAVDAIVISDAKGKLLQANDAAGILFQHAPEDLVGKDVALLMPNDLAEKHGDFMNHHMATGQQSVLGKSRRLVGKRADGSTFPLLLSLGSGETENGVVFVSIMHDCSDFRAMEQATERSQRMDAIGRMTGGIAHDFNNLLTVIIGNLELLESADLPDRQRRLLSDALSAAELGADLTSRLTVFARNSELEPTVLDLGKQLDQSMGLLRHTIGSHCEITTSASPDLWSMAADATQLQTAILNLVMNSQDAMTSGGTIALDAQNVEIDDTYVAQELGVVTGRYVRLSVSDTGKGMTPDERAHALEPFFTTKAVGYGTGLGLPMVYGFVKQSGGHLTIYSEPGEGTTISLYFPALAADQHTPDAPRAARPDPLAATGGGVVLIVEDDEKLRRLSKTRLTDLGYRCLTAETADVAWDILAERDDVVLVFSDMVMPGKMSGYDLAKRIAKERPEIAVLLTSGFSESVLRDRWAGEEFRMLRKPYRQAELERAVHAVLDDR